MISAHRRSYGAFLATLLGLLLSLAAHAAGVPVPPCTGLAAQPAYPSEDGSPVIDVWRGDGLDRRVPAPACLGWPDYDFSIMMAMAGRFHHAGGLDGMLADFGRFSSMAGLEYWSISDERWQVLIKRSAAVSDPQSHQVRPDFAPAEFEPGRDLYFLQRENRGDQDIVYRLHVLARGPDGFAVSVTNVSSIKFLFFRLFAPGDINSVYFFQRLGPDDWGYWAAGGTHLGLTGILGAHIGSFKNRAMAIYRHFAHVPDDQEPPAATEE